MHIKKKIRKSPKNTSKKDKARKRSLSSRQILLLTLMGLVLVSLSALFFAQVNGIDEGQESWELTRSYRDHGRKKNRSEEAIPFQEEDGGRSWNENPKEDDVRTWKEKQNEDDVRSFVDPLEDARPADARPTDANSANARATDALQTDARAADARATEVRVTEVSASQDLRGSESLNHPATMQSSGLTRNQEKASPTWTPFADNPLILASPGMASYAQKLNQILTQAGLANSPQVAFFLKNLRTGEVIAYNTEEPFYLASCIKVPVGMIYGRMVDEGKMTWQTGIPYEGSSSFEINGYTLAPEGSFVALDDLVRTAIIHSNNTSTSVLFRYFEDQGRYLHTEIDQVFQVHWAQTIQLNIVETSHFLEDLYKNLDHYPSYRKILSYMRQSTTKNLLAWGDVFYDFANKYGNIDGDWNDMGLILNQSKRAQGQKKGDEEEPITSAFAVIAFTRGSHPDLLPVLGKFAAEIAANDPS